MADSLAQNIPFGLARGMFGAINGAEFFGSPTICKVSRCSLPSVGVHLVDVDAGDSRIIRVIIEEKPRLKTGPFGN